MADKEPGSDATREEKLNFINEKLTLLHWQAKESKNIRSLKFASNLFSEYGRSNKKHRYISMFTKFSVLIGLFSCFIYCDPLYRYALASSRKLTIKVIPLWDWRWLHDVHCLMSNPLKSADQDPDIEICNKCANLSEIDRLTNTGTALLEKIAVSYLNEDIPVIIENVTSLWPNRGVINVEKLRQLYLDDEVMQLFMCCEFESNIPVQHGNHRALLNILAREKITQYYAHWQNCFKEAAKLFRHVYKRPDFLPSTVELAHTNWVFISSNFATGESKHINLPMDDLFTMLIQLEGHMDLILQPNEMCNSTCHTVQIRLQQGSAVILTDALYNVKYIPSNDEESITVGIGGSID